MPWNKHVSINGKKYIVSDQGEQSYQRIYDRQKVYDIGLTGKAIIQDFTISGREPHVWNLLLRVFTNDPWPDDTWGTVDDILEAMRESTVTYVWFDDAFQWTVGIEGRIIPRPRVGAAINGECHAIDYVQVTLVEVYS